jgi:hypothetical protein
MGERRPFFRSILSGATKGTFDATGHTWWTLLFVALSFVVSHGIRAYREGRPFVSAPQDAWGLAWQVIWALIPLVIALVVVFCVKAITVARLRDASLIEEIARLERLVSETEARLEKERERSEPQPELKLKQMTVLTPMKTDGTKATWVVISASVLNHGAPTALVGYRALIRIGAHEIVRTPLLVPPDGYTARNKGGPAALSYRPEDTLYEKTHAPLSRGDVKYGYLIFELNETEGEEFEHWTSEWRVDFTDYTEEKVYSSDLFIHDKDAPNRSRPIAHFPGLNVLPKKKDTKG